MVSAGGEIGGGRSVGDLSLFTNLQPTEADFFESIADKERQESVMDPTWSFLLCVGCVGFVDDGSRNLLLSAILRGKSGCEDRSCKDEA